MDEDTVDVVWVPGAWEIPLTCQRMARSERYDAIIALGAVVRGATPHFDHVATAVSRGIAEVGLAEGLPVINGVLTTDSLEQTMERAGTKAGNKGFDAAMAVLTGAAPAVTIAEQVRPEYCCLVPERREELTTEGGLDVAAQQPRITEACQRLREAGVRVSLFIDPEASQIEAAVESLALLLRANLLRHQTLRESQAKYRLLVENQNDLVVQFDILRYLENATETITAHLPCDLAQFFAALALPLDHDRGAFADKRGLNLECGPAAGDGGRLAMVLDDGEVRVLRFPEMADEPVAMPEFQVRRARFLIGGASLKPADFLAIGKSA